MNERDKNTNFLTELKRRRVLRSAAAYIVVAWVVVQVGSIVFPEFDAPAWSMRALIIVFIAGFPPAILLAWTVDVSKEGIVRTPESSYLRTRGHWPRVTTLLIATAMSAGVLWLVWDDYILQTGQRPVRTAIESQPVIAVNSPRQLVGPPENAWLGDGVANLIRSELAESRHAIVISRSRWIALTTETTSTEELSTLAQQIGVDYLIDGEYIETPDGIVLTTYIEDLASGTEIHSSRTSTKDVASLIASVPEHSISIKQALRIPHTQTVGTFGADFATENVAAYEAYIAGLAYFYNFDYEGARKAFEAALSLASRYHIAQLRLAQVYETTGRKSLAWTTLQNIPPDAELSERLRLYVAGAKAYFVAKQDIKRAIEVYGRLIELYPYEMEARIFLADAYWVDFQESASIAEFRRVTELHAYDPSSWMALGERLLDIGALDEAKTVLQKYASMQPKDPYAYSLLGNLAQLRGDTDSSVENHQRALELKPGFVVSTIGLARSRYLQGDVNAARTLWQSVVADEDQPASYRIDAAFEVAGMLRGLALYEDSLLPLTDSMTIIEEERLRLAMALSQLGSTQFELGNQERAQVLFDESIRIAPPPVTRYLFARGLAELRLGRFDLVSDLVDQILANSDETSSTFDDAIRAVNYLKGLSALQQSDLMAATTFLTAAVDDVGYRYAIYELGLARLYRATGEFGRAKELAEIAADYQDLGELRLDLELDRARAHLLLAEILAEQGEVDESGKIAQEFLTRWQDAAADLPEVIRAIELIAASAEFRRE